MRALKAAARRSQRAVVGVGAVARDERARALRLRRSDPGKRDERECSGEQRRDFDHRMPPKVLQERSALPMRILRPRPLPATPLVELGLAAGAIGRPETTVMPQRASSTRPNGIKPLAAPPIPTVRKIGGSNTSLG